MKRDSVLTNLALWVVALVAMAPLLWMVSVSFMSRISN